jgi:alpha-tubulin suppressor-like RCC1 family protein
MKKMQSKLALSVLTMTVGIFAVFTLILRAQETATPDQSIQAMSDLDVMLQALESTTPTPATSLPDSGTYWSAQHAPGTANAWPPLPGNMWGLSAWPMGDGVFLLNDTNLDYDALAAVIAAAQPAASPMMRMNMMSSSLSTAYAYGNPVYLTNMAASFAYDGSITASFGIAGGTNFVPYDILTTTNLTTPVANWNWIGIGYTSNNYTFYEQPASLGFYILAKPSKTMTVGIGNDAVGQCDVPYGLTNALQVAGGGGQSIAVKTDGTVVAWGANYYGEGVAPTNLSGVAMVSAGWYHDVALLTNGTVTAWGLDVPALGYYLTNVPPNLTNATVISAQALHTLALRSDGTVVAWGYNTSYGETNVPAGLTNVTAISAGYQFNLVVSNGYVVAWGDNTAGQCNVPPGLSNVVDVEAGTYHSLALLQNGTVAAWGDDLEGETDVPAGLSNIVAIAAGGDPDIDEAYSMALKKDGTLVVWGDDDVVNPFGGLSNVFGIAAGADHALAVRTGPPTPVITLAPVDQYQFVGGNVTFNARGAGLYGVTYQWQTNGVNLSGATNATLALTNVQTAQFCPYDVVVTDNGGMGSIVSSNANLYLVTAPVITSETLPTNQVVLLNSSVTLNVSASAPGQLDGFPISYQWQFDGTNIAGHTSSNYTFTAVNSGTYSLIVSNAAGSVTAVWQITVLPPGSIIPWGSNPNGELNTPFLTNVISLAAGKAHGVVALDSGSVTNWGSYWTGTNFVSVVAPPPLTNAIAVAAGSRHDLALKTDGTMVAWGLNDFGQTNVPASATNVVAIAAGGQQSVALLKNGTVLEWGQTNAPIPAGLTNVTAIAAGTNFCLALVSNSTVVAWGDDTYGETNVPANLTNVVAVAAGGSHALALLQNGTIVSWGDNTYGETNVPANLTNAMAIAAGDSHSLALLNNGKVVAWGNNASGQTNVVTGLNLVKLIAGGGDFSLAVQFSTTVSYPVNVSQDLLLIYNTNSVGSAVVENYYLQNRPLVGGANVLGIGCLTNEIITSANFTNQILAPYLNWLNQNPTKRPQYLVLFMDIPSRVDDTAEYFSVQYQLSTEASGIPSFVTSINMNGANGTNDCIAYINKLVSIGTNYSPGKLIISASAGGYGNTNYYFDDTETGYGGYPLGLAGAQAVIQDGVSSNSVVYTNVNPDCGSLACHITTGSNVAGYLCWGAHSSLGGDYAINGTVQWSGNSGWWIIETVESFNGQRTTSQGNFLEWFSSNAFGGTNYSNTPIGAVSHVEEPDLPGVENSAIYYGLWTSKKNFAICAWNARNTPYFQAVGDPFVTR